MVASASFLPHLLLRWLPFLLPALGCAWLMKHYTVDSPFMDDWTFLEDWIKWNDGSFRWSDLFTAHMEHRVTVPRFLALMAHLVGDDDLRWQNALSLLLMVGAGWNLLVLLRRTSGQTDAALLWPAALMMAVHFCAIQWQGILWAIMFETFVPIFSLTLILRWWTGTMSPMLAAVLSGLAALAGMWSFGNGTLLLLLTPVLMWNAGPHSETKGGTRRLLLLWAVIAVTAVGIYCGLSFENQVPPQYAYGQGKEVTMGHSLLLFLQRIGYAPNFIAATLGCHLSRGLHADSIHAARTVGYASLVLYLAALAAVWVDRRDEALRRAAVPWLVLGAFSIGTATLICMGRLWLALKSDALAITARYVSHAVPLTVALVALAVVLLPVWCRRLPWLRPVAWGLSGLLAALITVAWIYGERMMGLWQQTRLQTKATLLFAGLAKDPGALGSVTGDGVYTRDMALRLQKLNLMSPPLLKDTNIGRFKVSRKDLPLPMASFDALEHRPDDTWEAQGYAELPSHRPADLVLFSAKRKGGTERLFAFGTVTSLPPYMRQAMRRDFEYTAAEPLTPAATARWTGPIHLIDQPPTKEEIIDAWALDVERMQLYRINDQRLLDTKRFPPGLFPNSDRRVGSAGR